MTLEPKKSPRLRLTVGAALAGLAVALALGSAPGTARADVIDDLSNEFTLASGGGEIPSLLNQAVKLRNAGFKPTTGELNAISDSLKQRPNQTPMINALKAAVAGQTHRMAQANAANNNNNSGCCTIGINQYNPYSPGGVTAGPGGVNIGGGATPWQIGGQPGAVVSAPSG
jgi:hypothetical protein